MIKKLHHRNKGVLKQQIRKLSAYKAFSKTEILWLQALWAIFETDLQTNIVAYRSAVWCQKGSPKEDWKDAKDQGNKSRDKKDINLF